MTDKTPVVRGAAFLYPGGRQLNRFRVSAQETPQPPVIATVQHKPVTKHMRSSSVGLFYRPFTVPMAGRWPLGVSPTRLPQRESLPAHGSCHLDHKYARIHAPTGKVTG